MACILDGGTLTLSGDVGDFGWGDYFTAGEVLLALSAVEDGDGIVIHLNSGGGLATEGAAIHALLSRRSGTTNIVIDGIAASAASLIAMAGDTVSMSAGAVMMIHDPAAFTMGDSAAHQKSIEGLEALATAYARIYAAKSGKTPEEARAIMRAERWFSPEEAVTEGFADEAVADKAKPVAAFDYRAYAHAPKRLTALASKKDWRLPDARQPTASAPATPGPNKEFTMTDKERADAFAQEIAELKAQMKSSKDADETAALQEELKTLRAEKASRENADAIMALEEAKGRETQAQAMADAGVEVAKAKAILSASAKSDTQEEPRRLNGEGLGGGKPGPTAKGDKSVLAAAMARTNKRR